jgi:ribosomal protein S14
MEQLYVAGKVYAKPNSYCYNATINAIAKSSRATKAVDAYALLKRMRQAYADGNKSAMPTVTSFASVINACAHTQGSQEHKAEAFQIARMAFREILLGEDPTGKNKYGELSVIVFMNFLAACGKLLPQGEGRNKIASAAFRECADRGLVVHNAKVVRSFQSAVSRPVYRKVMEQFKAKLKYQ